MEYTADQIQEAHEWWIDRDVTLPNPYQEPRKYYHLINWYRVLLKPTATDVVATEDT